MKPTRSLLALTCSLALALPAAVPIRWTVETSRVQPAQFEAFKGESIALEAALQSDGKPLEIEGEPHLYWQTNGMGAAWWTAPAAVSSNVLSATWTPAMDVGANAYTCFIGVTGSIYRAAFQLRIRHAPGEFPNELPLPVPVIDFDRVTVLHPPWPSIEAVPPIVSNVVTKSYVEALGIKAGAEGAARPLPKYLHALDFADSYPDDAAWYHSQSAASDAQCSARRDGNALERNYDWRFDDAAEFVVRMAAGADRCASVGVANVGTNLTETFVNSGKWSRYYKALPGHTVDGINENGVVAEVNVVGGMWPRTTGEIHALGAVRWALDHATSAAMAASNLAAKVYVPADYGENFHWMLADERETWIVENGEAHQVTNAPAVMTNFALYPTRGAGEGQERYDALMGGANITSQWWTLTYTPSGYRPSDLPGIDAEGLAALWNYWGNNPRESHRGEAFGGESWWQTVHTSIYDISNRTVRIAVQETPDWYTFAVPSAGGVDAEAVREIVEPMIDEATSNKADRTELAGYLPLSGGMMARLVVTGNSYQAAMAIGQYQGGNLVDIGYSGLNLILHNIQSGYPFPHGTKIPVVDDDTVALKSELNSSVASTLAAANAHTDEATNALSRSVSHPTLLWSEDQQQRADSEGRLFHTETVGNYWRYGVVTRTFGYAGFDGVNYRWTNGVHTIRYDTSNFIIFFDSSPCVYGVKDADGNHLNPLVEGTQFPNLSYDYETARFTPLSHSSWPSTPYDRFARASELAGTNATLDAANAYTDAATNAVAQSVAAETARATAAELALQGQIDLFKSFQVIVTNSLPATGEDGCIYLTPIDGSTNRIEWLWIHVPMDHFEMIGTTSIDMAQYVTLDTEQTIPAHKTFAGAVTVGHRNRAAETGVNSVAAGTNAVASGYCSASFGYGAKARGRYSFAHGLDSIANDYCSFAVGEGAVANSSRSVAMGYILTANAHDSIALGNHVFSAHPYAMAWSGSSASTQYNSHGNGTFNVNPEGGLAGFWIGETNLHDHIVAVAGGGGTDGETVTNIVRGLAYERDGANEIVSNRWTQTAEHGVLPDYTATGATVGSVGYDALLTYTTNGTLTLPADTRVRVLAVGGGGGGAHGGNYFGRIQTGGAGGGGGGAAETNVTLAAGTYTFAPGAGGAGGKPISGGGSGGATTIAYGGMTIFEVPGGGGGGNYAEPGRAGGCGGGAGGVNANDATCAASIGDPGCFGGAPGADSNGFVRLEWAESTVAGRQFITIPADLYAYKNLLANEITMVGEFTSQSTAYQTPCGFSTHGYDCLGIRRSDDTEANRNKFGNDAFLYSSVAGGTQRGELAVPFGTKITITWRFGKVEVGGETRYDRQWLEVATADGDPMITVAGQTINAADINRPMVLFAAPNPNDGDVNSFSNFRLYGATIKQDGILKAELVPALKAGGVTGLYDEVSGRFFAPTGSVPLACSPYAVNLPGSGGGGMGTMGEGATATAAGRGGDGIASDITGETVYYAGGGGGGSALSGVSGGAGGLGGGGSGVTQGTEPAQKAGLDGFGAGGGGGGSGAFENSNGGAGGRGVVIVRIEHTGVVTNTVPYALMTDVPTAEEWQALKARLAEIEARLNAAGGE